MTGRKHGTLAPLCCWGLSTIQFWSWCLAFLILVMIPPSVAEAACGPSTVANWVAVEFLTGKDKVPQTLGLIDISAPQKPKIKVTNRGDGYWVSEPREGLIGIEHQLRTDLSIPGYSIKPVVGINRALGDKCYAVFSFTLEKIGWTLEVLPQPSFPFSFKANHENYVFRSPREDGKAWNLVKGLDKNDIVRLNLYEFQGDKPIFLFSLDFSPNMKDIHEDLDQIVEKVLSTRILYRFGKAKLPADLDPADPYLEIAKQQYISHSEQANFLAKEGVKNLLQLRSLILRDATEVKP